MIEDLGFEITRDKELGCVLEEETCA
jgi:hypothetical protein